MSSHTRKILEDYLHSLEIDTKFILDVGGSQLSVRKRLKRCEYNTYKILDLPNPHEGGQVDYAVNLDDNHEMLFRAEEQKPTCIFCLEVTEYLWNPLQAIKNMHSWLEPNGTLYISFPLLYPMHPPTGKDYMRYTKYGAVRLLKECGFKVEDVIRRGCKNPDNYMRFLHGEGYKHDKTMKPYQLAIDGVIIKAIKI